MLERFLSPHRVVTIHAFLHTWGTLFWLVPTLLVGMYFFLQYAGRKHEHVAYLRGNVLFSQTYATDTNGFSARFVVKLPEGEEIIVHTNSGALSASVVKIACIEKRRYIDSETFKYLLARQKKCGG